MNLSRSRDTRSTIIRLSASVVLASLAVVLFILNREDTKTPEELQQEFSLSAQAIDKGIDDILDHFGVEKEWVRKKNIEGGDGRFHRVERRVLIPPTIIPAMVNREMNLLARRFQGRAVATENLKENTVTIQILLYQSVIQTVILKTDQNIPTKDTREQTKKT